MQKRSISVIIPNFNGRKLLEEYLPFTIKALEAVEEWEIIVVDDASTDDSVAFMRKQYPEVKLIALSANRGFSHACNSGMKTSKYEYLFFQNSDIKLTADYFQNQWEVMEKEETFGVMGKILEMESHRPEISAKYPVRKGLKFKIDRQFRFEEAGQMAPTAFLSGANALVKGSKMKEIGGFDEIYSPFYFEDMDLGLRAWRMGWKCYFDEASICYHLGSFSINQAHMKARVKQTYFKNRLVMHGIHLEEGDLPTFRRQVLALEVMPKLLMGQWWIWRSYRDFLRSEVMIANSRERLSRLMAKHGSNTKLFEIIEILDAEMEGKRFTWV